MTLHEDFRAAWAEGTEAKSKVMTALGNAKLAEQRERDPDKHQEWALKSAAGAQLRAIREGKPLAEVAAITADQFLALAPQSSETYWKTVEDEGMTSGVEGQKKAAAQAIAEQWCLDNPATVEEIKAFAHAYQEKNPDKRWTDQQACVPLVEMYRAAGFKDKETEVEMYLLATFEPQHIGGQAQAVLRRFGGAQ